MYWEFMTNENLDFSLTESGSGKARHLEDPQTEFLLASGEMGEGRDKRQKAS